MVRTDLRYFRRRFRRWPSASCVASSARSSATTGSTGCCASPGRGCRCTAYSRCRRTSFGWQYPDNRLRPEGANAGVHVRHCRERARLVKKSSRMTTSRSARSWPRGRDAVRRFLRRARTPVARMAASAERLASAERAELAERTGGAGESNGGAGGSSGGGGAGVAGAGGAAGRPDAGDPGVSPALEMNDVTILAPLPQSSATPVLLRGTDLADDGTAFVPGALFDRLVNDSSTGQSILSSDSYGRLHLVARSSPPPSRPRTRRRSAPTSRRWWPPRIR